MEINNLPNKLGVYLFKDKKSNPLYIGKALNIKKRVADHLNLKSDILKERILVDNTVNIEAITVDSEIEALILEANLIKRFRPIYNSQLKDDKDFLYIKITNDEFPKVVGARKRNLKNSKKYFGPFPSTSKARITLKTLRKIFPFSNCKPNQNRACLYYHLGLCPGVCVGKISRRDYLKNIRALILFLQGNKPVVVKLLTKERTLAIKKLKFEKAAEIHNKLEALNYILRSVYYLEEDSANIRQSELKELASVVGLNKKPRRIECYDISNISGKFATGSMVVFNNALADRNEYRRFRIKTIQGINDTAMMAEVLDRRFRNDWPYPDLIIVDGGKGQLNAALAILQKININIPLIGLAKRLEEIYLPKEVRPIRLSRSSIALKLVQRLRDEAHRFAITYHRHLRSKQFLTSN